MDFKKLEYYERIEAKYRYLLSRFHAADVKMDGVCSWRFVHNPVLMGRSADVAVEDALTAVYGQPGPF